MPRKKKTESELPEANPGTPNTAIAPEPRAVVRKPLPLEEKVEKLIDDCQKVMKDPDFPASLGQNFNDCIAYLKVLRFHVATRR